VARDAGPAGTAVLCLALIAAASAALAAGGPAQEAHAQDLVLEPLGSLGDVSGNSRELEGASGVDVFTIGDNVYAVVAGHADHGIQIVGLNNPGQPTAAGRLGDGSAGHLRLAFPRGVEVFERGGNTYAAVVGEEDAVQVVDISDPAHPRYTASLVDASGLLLRDSFRAAAFERGSNTFLAVPSPTDNGLQIVEVTNASSPNPFSNVEDNESRLLRGAAGVDIFERGGNTYAVVASRIDDGIQLVDITNHHNPAARGALGELYSTPDARELDGAFDVAVFERGGRTYAAVTGYHDDGLQIVDVTDPRSLSPVGRLADTDDLRLRAPTGIDAFRIGAYTYVAVASDEDAIQIVDVSDPRSPSGAGKLADGGDLLLWNTNDVKVFEKDGSIYAAVTSYPEDGIQIVKIRHPDGLPPGLKSAALDWNTRILEITFDEAIDVSETRLSGMAVPVPGGSSIPLAGAAVKGGDSATVSMTLTKSQADQITLLDSPQIRVEGGAVSDLVGNTRPVVQSAAITVTGSDTEKPVITLRGPQDVTVELGGTYTEQGASVSDNDPAYTAAEATVGGDAVDTDTIGTYTVTYTAPADAAGNEPAPVSRTVTVRDTTPMPRPACALPASGHWDIRDSCMLESDTRAPAGITVHAPATLVIPAGVTLDVDLAGHGILIKQGAGLLIEGGGGMK